MRRIPVLATLCSVLGLMASASATTRHVPGQYPTIQAGMDAAVAGDTVLVACGTYVLSHPVRMKSGVTLRSETGEPSCVVLWDYMGEGLLNCWFVDEMTLIEGVSFTDANYNWAVDCYQAAPTFRDCAFYDNHVRWRAPVRSEDSTPTFRRCVFRDNSGPDSGGIHQWGGSLQVVECTFIDNGSGEASSICCWDAPLEMSHCTLCYDDAGPTIGMVAGHSASALIDNCVIAFGTTPVCCEGGATATASCCNFYGNRGGDWVECVEGQLGIAGNISADPLFCDPQAGDFRLDCASPCAPFSPPNPECDLIGAWPIGCGSTRIESRSWGAIKGLFR